MSIYIYSYPFFKPLLIVVCIYLIIRGWIKNENGECSSKLSKLFKLSLNYAIDINIPLILACIGIFYIFIDTTTNLIGIDGFLAAAGLIMLVASLIIIGLIKFFKFILKKIFSKKYWNLINLLIIITNLFIILFTPVYNLLGSVIGWHMISIILLFNTAVILLLFIIDIYSFIKATDNKIKD